MSEHTTRMLAATVRDNREALAQARALLADLTAEDYNRRASVCFNSTIGGHLRHVIEHYASFLHGVRTGMIDYEARARDVRIETDPEHALAVIESLDAQLDALGGASANPRLRVRSESAVATDPEPWGDSSALRELEFLLSHTVHHYALIGVIHAFFEKTAPEDFGVAPSTLRHRRSMAAGAAA